MGRSRTYNGFCGASPAGRVQGSSCLAALRRSIAAPVYLVPAVAYEICLRSVGKQMLAMPRPDCAKESTELRSRFTTYHVTIVGESPFDADNAALGA
ncbi:hypothetical protein Kim5_CH02650 [Rhizobium sp. Kim5]|nr:hypothetical protein Kim5_CH02650 [Rhizobium sp. Kim5]